MTIVNSSGKRVGKSWTQIYLDLIYKTSSLVIKAHKSSSKVELFSL